MTNSNGFNGERQGLGTRVQRYADFVQDWMFQLMLVAAVVGAVIECVLSLGGSTIV